jgi:hypothetical protein
MAHRTFYGDNILVNLVLAAFFILNPYGWHHMIGTCAA